MKFTRSARMLMPFIFSIIFACVYIYTIPYWHSNVSSKTFFIKACLILGSSLLTLTLSMLIRGYIDISLTIISYGILSTGIISFMSYTEIVNNTSTHNDLIIPMTFILIFTSILPEIHKRSALKKMAQWCLGGKRLEDYSKSPWSFLNERKKRLLSILYFDTPELSKIAQQIEPEVLRRTMNNILSNSIKTCSQHNGIFIRNTEDSILVAFEPSEKYGKMNTTETFSAYHSILCGMALKQVIEELKISMNVDSIKNLHGRVVISTDNGIVLQDIRRGKMELSLFSNAMNTISDIIPLSDGADVIIDSRTHDLCSEYFVTKSIGGKAFLVLGISGYYK
ncbi:MAG: hypothetical protein WCQ47_05410 [bacterium]